MDLFAINKKYSKIEHILVFTFMLKVILSIVIEYFELDKGILYSSFEVNLINYASMACTFILIGLLISMSIYIFRYITNKNRLYIYILIAFLFIFDAISHNYLKQEDASMRINGLISLNEIRGKTLEFPDNIDKNSTIYKDMQAKYLEIKQLETSNQIEFDRLITALEERVEISIVMINIWIVYVLLVVIFSLLIPQSNKIDGWIE